MNYLIYLFKGRIINLYIFILYYTEKAVQQYTAHVCSNTHAKLLQTQGSQNHSVMSCTVSDRASTNGTCQNAAVCGTHRSSQHISTISQLLIGTIYKE
jgi:hypothetical protein